MSNINGQLTPVLQQNTSSQILTNDKMKQQAQQQILQQVRHKKKLIFEPK